MHTTPKSTETIDALIACGPLKAWSVIVTVLGDLCLTPEDRISGRTLNDLLGSMGISDQTVRVALHRLRRDGWVRTDKRGRGADYALSDKGWRETQAVWDRIYSNSAPDPRPVGLAHAPPKMAATAFSTLLPRGSVQLGPKMAIVESSAINSDDLWTTPINPEQLPDWVKEAVAPPELCADYTCLYNAAQGALSVAKPEDITLRLLCLHHWRRLRLRHGDLPDLLLGPDWPGAMARRAVMAVLDTVPRTTA